MTDRQTHREEKLMPCANLMCILYKKGILHEADLVSRHPDFLPVDNLRGPNESLWWDGNVSHADTNDNQPALLPLSTLEVSNSNDDFLSRMKGAYSSCYYISYENNEMKLRQTIEKSSDILFRYHNRAVIPRPISALIKAYFI